MDVNITGAFQRMLKTDDGKIVMDYLERNYLYGRIHDETMSREVGQRDVVLLIRRIQEKRI